MIYRRKTGDRFLATFEPTEIPYWANNAAADRTVSADTVLYTQGTQGLKLNMPTGGQLVVKKHLAFFDAHQIASSDKFSIDVYLTALPNDWLRISLTNNLAGTGDILRRSLTSANLALGWNTITWTRSQMSALGAWAATPRALGVQIDLYHNAATPIAATFDNFKVSIATDIRL